MRGRAAMLLELTPDECRFLRGMLNEQFAEVRAEISRTDDDEYVQELKRDEIRLGRIIHRLTAETEFELKKAG